MTYKLNLLIGKDILFTLSPGKPMIGQIVGVEDVGVWIQSKQFLQAIYAAEPSQPSLREPVFFVPMSTLRWVMVSEEQFYGEPKVSTA
jgi:hypothetical protein